MSQFHLHSPPVVGVYPVPPAYTVFRMGLWYVETDCCGQNRLADNCELHTFEWYEARVVCKAGKGCQRRDAN